MATQRVLIGDASSVLATLPERSVHCVVTSPPYFGLRAYGCPPQIWGGDPACGHAWHDAGRSPQRIRHGQGAHTLEGHGADNRSPYHDANVTLHPSAGATCARCGAWRGELGAEPALDLYVAHLTEVMRAVWRVLRDDGCLFLNLGDSFAGGGRGGHGEGIDGSRPQGAGNGYPRSIVPAGHKPKDLLEVPSEVVRALKADGWWLRSRLPWLKANPLPESVRDRPTSAVEYVFLLAKQSSYYWDPIAVARSASGPAPLRDWAARKAAGEAVRRGMSPTPQHHSGGVGGNGATRQFRNADLWFDSRAPGFWDDDGPAEHPRPAYNLRSPDPAPHENPMDAPQNREVAQNISGLLLDEAGDPLALEVNPVPYAGAHFATFAPKLVEPLIRAATSERGVCPACLSPYRRKAERGDHAWAEREAHPAYAPPGQAPDSPKRVNPANRHEHGLYAARTTTTGWAPTCACDAGDPIPAVVLDPFSGAGTTGLVCAQLGRDYVGIELNAEYAEQSRVRLAGVLPLFNTVEVDG